MYFSMDNGIIPCFYTHERHFHKNVGTQKRRKKKLSRYYTVALLSSKIVKRKYPICLFS